MAQEKLRMCKMLARISTLGHLTDIQPKLWKFGLSPIGLDVESPIYKVPSMLIEKRVQESAINPKSGHYLELGHQTAPEETAPFNEFWLVFHEPKFNPGVKDEGPTI
ncbi:hypothetical protein B0H14DRAFT_2583690 [Mycena olivaceomarginata]|nr:hypothetical protein B0H14DRAFT_2583690 [Mycena olivaceomarginata]